MSPVDELKALDLKTVDLETISQILVKVSSGFGATRAKLYPNTYIARMLSGWGLNIPSGVTYNKNARYSPHYQRMTLPGDVVFYGCISNDQHKLENTRAICIAECSKLARAGVTSIGIEHFTSALWLNMRPLKIMTFITDNTFPAIRGSYIEAFREQFRKNKPNLTLEQLEMAYFLDAEFTKIVQDGEDWNYKITALLAHDIFATLPNDEDAIIYPSIQMGGQAGMNIAIRPEVVDSSMRVDYISEISFYKYHEKACVITDQVYDSQRHPLPTIFCPESVICQKIGVESLSVLPVIS